MTTKASNPANGALDEPSNALLMSVAEQPSARPLSLRSLLWCEWFSHSRLLLGFLIGWLVMVWVLPLFAHPGWILSFGLVYALLAGPAFGGSDIIRGCEEFALSLPATRSEVYRSRLIAGLGGLLVFTSLDVLAIGLDLSQALARLYLDTGLMKPWRLQVPGLLSGLVFVLPLTVFSMCFAVSANARSRGMVFSAWFWAALMTVVLLRLGLLYETWRWQVWNGYASFPSLCLISLAALWFGHTRFVRKEVVAPTGRFNIPSQWWVWILIALLGLAVLSVVLRSLIADFGRVFGG